MLMKSFIRESLQPIYCTLASTLSLAFSLPCNISAAYQVESAEASSSRDPNRPETLWTRCMTKACGLLFFQLLRRARLAPGEKLNNKHFPSSRGYIFSGLGSTNNAFPLASSFPCPSSILAFTHVFLPCLSTAHPRHSTTLGVSIGAL